MSGWPRAVCVIGALATTLGACECNGTSRPSHIVALERDIADQLGEVFGADHASVVCPGGDVRAGFVCAARVSSRPAFRIEVSGVDSGGAPVWKPRGKAKFEYEITRAFAARVGVRPSVVCPDHVDVAAGFDCGLALPDGFTTAVSVTASDQAARFSWTAREILMLAPIEARIARELEARGRAATVDCGRAVQKSIPGASFECAVRSGHERTGTAVVTVVDRQGNVRYRLDLDSRGGR